MIISIGSFIFDAPDITGIKEQITPHFGAYRPIGDNPHYHDTNGSVEKISIGGVYIADSNSKPETLRSIARAKRPVRFTMASGQSIQVIVTSFSTDKKNFLPYAGAVNVDFQIELTAAGGSGFGLFSIIGAILALF